MDEDGSPPSNVLEISVFGGGYGECICMHIGDGSWIIIDSFRSRSTKNPVSLDYLNFIDAVPEENVRLVIATHWDDDHIRGIAEVAEVCAAAKIVISGALSRHDARVFMATRSQAKTGFGSGLDEMVNLIQIGQSGGRLVWASANKVLWTSGLASAPPSVVALSPSEDTLGRSIEWLVGEANDSPVPLSLRYRAPDSRNGTSVVSFVNSLGTQALFGADLENTPNPEAGWEAILNHANPGIKASAFKVPHHGSSTSQNERIWTELLENRPFSVVAPWTNAGGILPLNDDVNYYVTKAGSVYLTAPPLSKKATVTPEIDRLIRRMHGKEVRELVGAGHVRARKGPVDLRWDVQMFGDAAEIAAVV